MNNFKKAFAVVIASAMCLSMGLPAVAAEGTVGETYQAYQSVPRELPGLFSTGNNYWGDQLTTPVAKKLYAAMDAYFAGNPTTSKLVVTTVTGSDIQDFNDVSNAYEAILADRTDTSYWVNKTQNFQAYPGTNEVTLYFPVNTDYKGSSAGTDTYNVLNDQGQTVQQTVEYFNLRNLGFDNYDRVAQDIVNRATGSDAEKVRFFVEEICRLTSYDTNAASGNEYSSPYQMTSVFDGDPTTGSVCEGYSKALEYLCTKAGIECILVTGTSAYAVPGQTGGTPANHMWTLVKLGGEYWCVDPTNSDSGTVGSNGELILVGKANADYQKMTYTYEKGSGSLVAAGDHYTGSATVTYNITNQSESSATVSFNPSTLTGLAGSASVTITVTPATGYETAHLVVDGTEVTLTNNQYVLNMNNSNHTVKGYATKTDSFRVTLTKETGISDLTLTPAAANNEYKKGTEVTLTVKLAAGYENPVVKVNGTQVTLAAGNTYKFTVNTNTTITAGATKSTYVKSIAVAPANITIGYSTDNKTIISGMENGGLLTATITLKDDGKPYEGTVEWSSSDASIVSVASKDAYNKNTKTATAVIAPKGYNGTVTIYAKADGVTGTATVKVEGANNKPSPNPNPEPDPGPGPIVPGPDSNYYPNWSGTTYSTKSGKKNKKDVSDWTSPSERASGKGTGTSNTFKAVNETEVVNETTDAVKEALKAGGETGTVTVRNALSISYAALKSMQSAATKAGGSNAVLQADTMKGNMVESRIYLDTSKLPANAKGDLKLRVYTSNPTVKDHFTKFYKNKIAALRLEQTGSFGMEVEIATKIDLTGMDLGNLVFHVYDSKTNSFEKIANPKYYIDTAGYLHFFTSMGGNIVISSGELKK